MKMKRFLSVLLALVMVIGSLPVVAADADTGVQAGTSSVVNAANSAARAVSYTSTYTGSQSNLTLSSGSYLLNGTTVSSSAGSSAITISSGAAVKAHLPAQAATPADGQPVPTASVRAAAARPSAPPAATV